LAPFHFLCVAISKFRELAQVTARRVSALCKPSAGNLIAFTGHLSEHCKHLVQALGASSVGSRVRSIPSGHARRQTWQFTPFATWHLLSSTVGRRKGLNAPMMLNKAPRGQIERHHDLNPHSSMPSIQGKTIPSNPGVSGEKNRITA
jgi:hypothetical protein